MTKGSFLPTRVATTITNLTNSSKTRRNRTSFTRYQLEEMERVFRSTHYPDANIRQVMSEKLDLQEAKIQVNESYFIYNFHYRGLDYYLFPFSLLKC